MSWVQLKQYEEENAKLAGETSAMLKLAGEESRELTKEELEVWNAKHSRIEKIHELADQIRKQEAADKSIEQRIGREEITTPVGKPVDGKKAFTKFIRQGFTMMSDDERRAMYQSAYVTDELRANLTSTGAGSGLEFVPEDFYRQLTTVSLSHNGPIKAGCTVINSGNSQPLPVPTVDDTANSAEIVAENAAVASPLSPTTSGITLGGYPTDSKPVVASLSFIMDSFIDVDTWLAELLGERLGRFINTKLSVGSGSGEPQGCVTGTSAHVTAASPTAITYNNILDTIYTPDMSYHDENFRLMFNQTTLVALKKLVDSQNRPLWNAGNVAGGTPPTFDGYQYIVNNAMASPAASAKPILVGNFKRGYIARLVKGVQLFRLNEYYLIPNLSVGYLGVTFFDGGVKDAKALAYLQMAAS